MRSKKTVEGYIEAHPKWAEGLRKLIGLLRATELEETIKWGSPHYVYQGKNVIGVAAFKNHFALWFHQGVFLKDPHQVLYNAQEGKTKGLRQIRFSENHQVKKEMLLPYIREAIENEKAGKNIKMVEPGKYDMPELLRNALSADREARQAFNQLTPGRQKEYATYISSAKRTATKESRIAKILPMIRQGLGLNDKYRN